LNNYSYIFIKTTKPKLTESLMILTSGKSWSDVLMNACLTVQT
jgi:hypothetical protein